MSTTFNTIHKDLHAAESFADDYQKGTWGSLTKKQSAKLQKLLMDDNQYLVDGDFLSLLSDLDDTIEDQIVSGLHHMYLKGSSSDLTLMERMESKSMDWTETIGPLYLEDIHLLYPDGHKELSSEDGKRMIVLLHGDVNSSDRTMKIQLKLIQVTGQAGPKIFNNGLVYARDLSNEDFLSLMKSHSEHVLVGKSL